MMSTHMKQQADRHQEPNLFVMFAESTRAKAKTVEMTEKTELWVPCRELRLAHLILKQ